MLCFNIIIKFHYYIYTVKKYDMGYSVSEQIENYEYRYADLNNSGGPQNILISSVNCLY